jgi:hypothetical protein
MPNVAAFRYKAGLEQSIFIGIAEDTAFPKTCKIIATKNQKGNKIVC